MIFLVRVSLGYIPNLFFLGDLEVEYLVDLFLNMILLYTKLLISASYGLQNAFCTIFQP